MLRRWFSNWTLMALSVFIVEMAIMISLSPNILNLYNLSTMLNNFLVIGIMAASMCFVIIMGGIDLSIGSIVSLSGMSMGLLWQGGMPIWLAAVAAIAIGCLAGWLNGFIIVYTRIQPLIATLATMFIYSSIALVLGGENSISGFPSAFHILGTGAFFGVIPVQVVILAAVSLIFGFLLQKTMYGRMVTYIGNNENSAVYSGIAVNKIKLWTYAISGVTAGIAGVILGSYFSAVRGDMGYQFEFLVITACLVGGVNVFGGSGTILGVVLGMLILGMLNQGMNMLNISSVEQKIITGIILLIAVAVQQINTYFTRRRSASSGVLQNKEVIQT